MENSAPTASGGAADTSSASSSTSSSSSESASSTSSSSEASSNPGLPSGTAAPSQGDSTAAQEIAKQKFKFTLPVNGQEVEREFDEDSLKVHLQKALAADQRFREAAEMRKQAEQIRSALKNPQEFAQYAQQFGADPKQLAMEMLWPEVERDLIQQQLAQLPPEQRQIYELQQKVQQYENQLKQQEQARHQAELNKHVSHYQEEYSGNFMQAAQAAGFDESLAPQAIQRMAQLALENLQEGIEVPPAMLAEMVKEEISAQRKAFLPKNLTPETAIKTFAEWYGPEVVQMVVRGSVAGLPQVPSPSNPVAANPAAKTPQKEEAFPDDRDREGWNEYFKKLGRG